MYRFLMWLSFQIILHAANITWDGSSIWKWTIITINTIIIMDLYVWKYDLFISNVCCIYLYTHLLQIEINYRNASSIFQYIVSQKHLVQTIFHKKYIMSNSPHHYSIYPSKEISFLKRPLSPHPPPFQSYPHPRPTPPTVLPPSPTYPTHLLPFNPF